jgi:hypothetical protein
MKDELIVITFEVVMRIVWMVLSIEGWVGHFFECKPCVGVRLIGVIAVLVAHKRVKAECILLVCQDSEDGVHPISHVGEVFVNAVDNHQAQMLLGDELVEVLRLGGALEVFLEDLLDGPNFRLYFNHSNTV